MSQDNQPVVNSAQMDYIDKRWRQLAELQKEALDRAYQYLMVTNAGGAIATLSFIGASKISLEQSSVKWTLICFVLGVVFVGLTHLVHYYNIKDIFDQWRTGVNGYFRQEISYNYLIDSDNQKSNPSLINYLFPYLSFLAFNAGCLFGAYAAICS